MYDQSWLSSMLRSIGSTETVVLCPEAKSMSPFLHNLSRMVIFLLAFAVWGILFVAVAPISFYSNTIAAIYAFVFLTVTFSALVTWGDRLDKFFKQTK